jgi:hypothetical protein
MAHTKPALVRDDVLWFLDTGFASWNWAHKSVPDALKGLTPREAVWRPGRNAHSVWEQINRIAHWKGYIVECIRGRRLRAHQAWPAPGRTAGELRRSIAALMRLPKDLRAAVLSIESETFAQLRSGKYSLAQLLLGGTAHEPTTSARSFGPTST